MLNNINAPYITQSCFLKKIGRLIPCHNATPLRLGTFASTMFVFQKNHEIELGLIKAIAIDRLTSSNSLLPWAC
jgi:hypothetical protein